MLHNHSTLLSSTPHENLPTNPTSPEHTNTQINNSPSLETGQPPIINQSPRKSSRLHYFHGFEQFKSDYSLFIKKEQGSM